MTDADDLMQPAMYEAIGHALCSLVAACPWMGWSSPASALPYIVLAPEPRNVPAAIVRDLVAWTTGDQDAGDRLRYWVHDHHPDAGELAAAFLH